MEFDQTKYKTSLLECVLHEKSFSSEGLKEFDKDVQNLFPMIFNVIKGRFQYLIPLFASRAKSEEKIQSERIKNLNLEIRINASVHRNAYTYPSFTGRLAPTLMQTILPAFAPLMVVVNGYNFLSKNSHIMENTVNKNGVVIFPNEIKKIKCLSYVTKGTLQALKEEERTAVLLHEIGHWVKINPILNKMGLVVLSTFIPPLALFCLIGGIAYARSAEWEADAFAKQCGYGPQLANALENMSINTRKDINFFLKFSDWFIKIFSHIHNVVDVILPISTHPSVSKRVKTLHDAELHDGYVMTESDIDFEDLIFLREEFLQEGTKEALYGALRPLCNKFDKIVAPNLNKFFPV